MKCGEGKFDIDKIQSKHKHEASIVEKGIKLIFICTSIFKI